MLNQTKKVLSHLQHLFSVIPKNDEHQFKNFWYHLNSLL